MNLLFISRAYPPVIGGLETHNQRLHAALQRQLPLAAIINRRGRRFLPCFIPYALCLSLIRAARYDTVLLGDGVLAIVGYLLKLLCPRMKVVCVVHGLDITYRNPIYQSLWVRLFLPKLDKLVAVSRATAEAARLRGIEADKIAVISNGIDACPEPPTKDRNFLEPWLDSSADRRLVLLSLGRLVKRKGAHWFVTEVMPRLRGQCVYLIAGDGPEKDRIAKAIAEHQLQGHVHLLGGVGDAQKSVLLAHVDLFLQPNIKVPGDMEGFGISVLEANLCRLPVLAANLEGLQDAVSDGENGWLVASQDADAYVAKIQEFCANPESLPLAGQQARLFCLAHFTWDKIAAEYLAQLQAA